MEYLVMARSLSISYWSERSASGEDMVVVSLMAWWI